MGEDETKILGDEEPVEESEMQKAPTTQPMLKEILEEIRNGFGAVNQRLDGFETRLNRIENRLETLENDTREMRRSQRSIQRQQLDMEDRIEDLERKAS